MNSLPNYFLRTVSRAKSFHLAAGLAAAFLAVASTQAQLGDRQGEPQSPPPAELNIPPALILTPEEALKTLVVPPGFRVDLVAADPLIQDPVAIAFDPKGRMFVAELGSYNTEILERLPIYVDPAQPPPKPVGRVSILSDTNGDGRMDKRTVFLDNLAQPRAIGFWKGKVLVGDPPNLWLCSDTNGDGVADEKVLITDDYVFTDPRNVESAPNGLVWNRDNWLYNASYRWRMRFVDGKWAREPMPRLGQWGIAQDDFGRMYFDSNSDKLRAALLPPHYQARAGVDASLPDTYYQVALDQAVWPVRPTPGVNRGYEKGFLRDDGTLSAVTAASAPTIYRGGNFPARYAGNAFVPEPVANTVQRMVLREAEGRMTAMVGYEQTDFLSSTDERFRPVFVTNAPDGALYVVDMHRGFLEGYEFATTYLREQILKRGLHKPLWGQGRIYRVVYTAGPLGTVPDFATAAPAKLVEMLDDRHGWTRDQAQRRIVESERPDDFAPRLRDLMQRGSTERQRLNALWSLEGLGVFGAADLAAGLKDSSAQVRIAAIRAGEALLQRPEGEVPLQTLAASVAIEDPFVLAQLVLSLEGNASPTARNLVWPLFDRAAEHPSLLDAVLLTSRDRQPEVLEHLIGKARGQAVPTFGGRVVLAGLASRIALRSEEALHQKLVGAIKDSTVPEWCRIALMQGVVQPDLRGAKPGTRIQISSVLLAGLSTSAPDPLVRRFAGQATTAAKQAEARRTQRVRVPPLTPPQEFIYAQGKEIFALCAACHQPDGLGKEALAPALKDGRWSAATSPDAAIRIVLFGKQGTPGFPAAMVPLATMSNEQLAAVLTYVRRSFGNQASVVTSADVARVRGETAGRTGGWTDAELEKVLPETR